MSIDLAALLKQYRSELLDRTIPFWLRYGVDREYGGICTCISDDGRVLSTDKYMWSQLRALYTFSALYNHIEPQEEWLAVAENIFHLVTRYGRDESGQWLYVISADGRPLQGAVSIYTDAFAIYGLTEYARATGNRQASRIARETFENVRTRLAQPGPYPTAPHPVPAGMKAHGIAMTFALVFEELGRYLNDPTVLDAGIAYADQVMKVFRHSERERVYEFVTQEDALLDAPPGLTVVPGHVLESMWFMIHIYRRMNDPERIRQAIETIRWHAEFGWDAECGGIVLARDAQGSRWEKIADTKIWWPHTEALYALLLAYSISREQWCLDWLARVHEYSYAHFPVPGYGEWIQNLDRQGNKLDEVVGLPVKDPFHLSRSLINCIGVLQEIVNSSS